MVKQSKIGVSQIRGLNTLLNDFQTAFVARTPDSGNIEQHQQLLAEFGRMQAVWKKEQVLVAENFNLLRILRLTSIM